MSGPICLEPKYSGDINASSEGIARYCHLHGAYLLFVVSICIYEKGHNLLGFFCFYPTSSENKWGNMYWGPSQSHAAAVYTASAI